MEEVKIWFDDEKIFIETAGKIRSQSLKWYPLLRNATQEERDSYRLTSDGIRWDGIDEDVSFESFEYDNNPEQTPLQNVFENLPEINVSKFAARMGIPQSVFASYLCGAKKPSAERLKKIEKNLRELGKELLTVKL